MRRPKDASWRLRAASKANPEAGADTNWARRSPTSAPTKQVNACAVGRAALRNRRSERAQQGTEWFTNGVGGMVATGGIRGRGERGMGRGRPTPHSLHAYV